MLPCDTPLVSTRKCVLWRGDNPRHVQVVLRAPSDTEGCVLFHTDGSISEEDIFVIFRSENPIGHNISNSICIRANYFLFFQLRSDPGITHRSVFVRAFREDSKAGLNVSLNFQLRCQHPPYNHPNSCLPLDDHAFNCCCLFTRYFLLQP